MSDNESSPPDMTGDEFAALHLAGLKRIDLLFLECEGAHLRTGAQDWAYDVLERLHRKRLVRRVPTDPPYFQYEFTELGLRLQPAAKDLYLVLIALEVCG